MSTSRPAYFLLLGVVLALLSKLPHISCQGVDYTHLEARAQQLREKVAAKPDDFQLLVSLATALHQLDHSFPDGGKRIPEAERLYRSAISAAPSKSFAAVLEGNLGALLMSAGRLQEALDKMDESIATSTLAGQPDSEVNVGALFNRGKALGMMGRETDAQAAFRKAMRLARGVAPATWAKACASLKPATPAELEQMEKAATFLMYGTGIATKVQSRQHAHRQMAASLLHQEWGWLEKTPGTDTCWLFFALYAAFDEKGKVGKAWEHLEEANRLQCGSRNSGGASQDAQLLSALTSIFERPPAGRAEGTYEALLAGAAGYPDESPVFVVGVPRSGSTLVEQILASHPQVFGAGEDTALAPLMPSLFKALEGEGGQVSLSAVTRVGEAYVREMRRRVPAGRRITRIVDKMLRNVWNLGHIAFILPKAKIVWAVRHPMDVVLSCFAQPFEGRGTPWACDLDGIAEQVALTHAMMAHWEAVLPFKILRLPYEDLVTGQEATSRRMLRHCGLPWNAAVLEFHNATREVHTASLSQVRRRMYTSSVGRWKRYSKHLAGIRQKLKELTDQYEKDVRSAAWEQESSAEL